MHLQNDVSVVGGGEATSPHTAGIVLPSSAQT